MCSIDPISIGDFFAKGSHIQVLLFLKPFTAAWSKRMSEPPAGAGI